MASISTDLAQLALRKKVLRNQKWIYFLGELVFKRFFQLLFGNHSILEQQISDFPLRITEFADNTLQKLDFRAGPLAQVRAVQKRQDPSGSTMWFKSWPWRLKTYNRRVSVPHIQAGWESERRIAE